MKYKKAITALALAALLLAGCAAPQAVQAPAPQQKAKAAETQSGVTFTDAMGYPVTVQSWNRVVSLYGSFAEAWTLAGGTLTATTEDAIKERGLDLGNRHCRDRHQSGPQHRGNSGPEPGLCDFECRGQ